MKNMTFSGFTLLETMVAVTIITVAIAGPMLVASRAIIATKISRDQLTASYLAQEGIEYVRAMRDNAYLALYPGDTSNAWSNFLTSIANCRTSALNNAPFCIYEPTGSGSLQVCPSGVCAPLWLDVYYSQTALGTKTAFTREIQTISITANDERIVSEVSWNYHGTTYLVTISDHLTPWQ